MKTLFVLLLILFSFHFSFPKKLNYHLVFEYLYSDEKDTFELDLFNRPKIPSLDFGEEIFYSGQIERIENYPVNKLINFTKDDFKKNKEKEEKKYTKGKAKPTEENKTQKEKKHNKENIIKPRDNKTQKENSNIKEKKIKDVDKKIPEEKKEKEYSENDYDEFDNLFFSEPIIRSIFDNDYNKYIKFINQYNLKNNKEKTKKQNNQNQTPYIQIIQPENKYDIPVIRIINYPNNGRYKTTNINNSPNTQYDPYNFYNEFEGLWGFDNLFQSFESELNNMYRVRFLSEKTNKEKNENNKNSKQKIFSYDNHEIVFISNKLYFDYIKYLPKNTIIVTPRQFANDIKDKDYYIFTIKDAIAISGSIDKSMNTYYKVKIGQNFDQNNIILIALSVTVFICLLGIVMYSYLIRRYGEEDILPVQNLISKFPQYLCLLNILMYFSFIGSYNDSDGYFIIVKFVSLFLYSLFKSIFICIIILLLNGWMTLTFIAWAQKLNRVIPIIFFEIITSIAFEIIGFYDVVPYNKLQLYYFRDLFENIIIVSIAFFSINKYYIPLNKKCKYLSIINSDFNDAYNLKKKKMMSFSIFAIIYSTILLFADYYEFDYINKYLQNNSLHVIREIIFISILNFTLMLLLLPGELPYLFTEETDLLKCEYLLGNIKEKNILEINDKEIKNVKKQIDKNENVQIILVSPFFENKNQNDKFEELYIGNATNDI